MVTKQNNIQRGRKPDGDGSDTDSNSEPEDSTDAVFSPMKVIVDTETLELHYRISFVNFSSLYDHCTI